MKALLVSLAITILTAIAYRETAVAMPSFFKAAAIASGKAAQRHPVPKKQNPVPCKQNNGKNQLPATASLFGSVLHPVMAL